MIGTRRSFGGSDVNFNGAQCGSLRIDVPITRLAVIYSHPTTRVVPNPLRLRRPWPSPKTFQREEARRKRTRNCPDSLRRKKIRGRRCSGTSYRRTTLGCLSSFSVMIFVFMCATAATNEQARRKNPRIDPWIGQKGARTCSSVFMARMRWRSRILMAKGRPVLACRASLTLPKCPSPSVRPPHLVLAHPHCSLRSRHAGAGSPACRHLSAGVKVRTRERPSSPRGTPPPAPSYLRQVVLHLRPRSLSAFQPYSRLRSSSTTVARAIAVARPCDFVLKTRNYIGGRGWIKQEEEDGLNRRKRTDEEEPR
ncbi:uncharacterized protein LOC123446442 [Hordeum vulgare subsp. vulgare]|uniref:uncharacterized protein LOC123446442 n=1 Tax=Hordeum vulgare subsp. vulgare TaxID=112509 RepID=UPI00162B89B0|nr:uncharacterized protein LOC123446442 [Hordeum vulgare subsp. vulgare]